MSCWVPIGKVSSQTDHCWPLVELACFTYRHSISSTGNQYVKHRRAIINQDISPRPHNYQHSKPLDSSALTPGEEGRWGCCNLPIWNSGHYGLARCVYCSVYEGTFLSFLFLLTESSFSRNLRATQTLQQRSATTTTHKLSSHLQIKFCSNYRRGYTGSRQRVGAKPGPRDPGLGDVRDLCWILWL